MKLKQNKSGFTLLEIIIVIIIVGILASLAMPRFLNTVSLSKATEALTNMGALKDALDRYREGNSNTFVGATFANLDVRDPNTLATPGRKFTYVLSGLTATGWVITASLVGGVAADTIIYTYSEPGAPPVPTLVRSMGAGVFVNLK